jgi:hypothetical protein
MQIESKPAGPGPLPLLVPGGSVGDPDQAFVGCRFAMELARPFPELPRSGPEAAA